MIWILEEPRTDHLRFFLHSLWWSANEFETCNNAGSKVCRDIIYGGMFYVQIYLSNNSVSSYGPLPLHRSLIFFSYEHEVGVESEKRVRRECSTTMPKG